MNDVNSVILQSIRSDLEQTKLIGQNIANASTPGYKSIQSNAIDFLGLVNSANLNNNSSELISKKINMSNGQLQTTGRALDLSINGKGFFIVETNGVEHLLTSHQFKLNEDNYIVTHQGGKLQGLNGDIKVESSNLKISTNGEVTAKEKIIDQIRIVKPSVGSKISLHPMGFLISDSLLDAEVGEFTLSSGQLQMSNVDSSQQMVKLMELTKHIESNQRAFSTLDQIFNTGINQIGKN